MVVRGILTGSLAALLAACVSTPPPFELRSVSGPDLYGRLCASCHGAEGHGDGPVAPLLTMSVPDLTRIAARESGEFPVEEVRGVIDGRLDRRPHGSREMPVWGWQLYDISNPDFSEERARADSLIDRLVSYLQSIQRP